MDSFPRTPFSTPLSGSARETEERIRNIFQYQKKRPPALLLALACALALLCGGLVSCQTQAEEEGTDQNVPAIPSAWMEPELGTTSLGTVLGYPMTVTHTVEAVNQWYDYQPVHWYNYQVQLPDGTWFHLTGGNAPSLPLDLDGDGQEELITNDPVNGGYLFAYCRYPDGSVRSLDLRDAAMDLLGLTGEGYLVLNLEVRPEDKTAVVRSADDPTQELAVFPLSQLLAETRSGGILLSAPGEDGMSEPFYSENPIDGSTAYFYQGMNLDGAGGLDDDLAVTSYGPDVGNETRVEVTLGTGEVLTWTEPGFYFPVALPGYLSRTDRQSLVLELDVPYSNYGAAFYVVLEVENGALLEQARPDVDGDAETLLWSACLQDRVDGLQELRVPVFYDKWHAPIWHTLTWKGAQFQLVSDGFFTDTYSLRVSDGRTLTLALRCTPGEDYSWDCYDQIQILEGDTLLQAISPSAAQLDSRAPFQSFLVNPIGQNDVDIQDINFDGYEDFGLQCDSTHNEVHAWFVWDGEAGAYRYLTLLGGQLTLDSEARQLEEVWWIDDPAVVNTYVWDEAGQLQLIDSRPQG